VARRERNGPTWYLGAITDEEARTFDVPTLVPYARTEIRRRDLRGWAGGELAHESAAVTISKRPVDATSRLHIVLAPGGGQAIRIRPAR